MATQFAKILFYRASHRFQSSLSNPEKAQQKIFNKVSQHLAMSLYGASLDIRKNMSYEAFSARAPIVEYQNIEPWIEKQKQGINDVLSPDQLQYFEKTSGSSSKVKYIPYTAGLIKSFYNMFKIWSYDILKNGPQFEFGKIFMSISPCIATDNKTTIKQDNQYLGFITRLLIKPFLIQPPCFAESLSINEFRYLLAAILISEENLEIISIWNPTYLLMIMETIANNRHKLIADLTTGIIRFENVTYTFTRLSPARAALLSQVDIPWSLLWNRLKLISCWTSHTARSQSLLLSTFFPNILIQGKGLLATEAPITLPLMNANGYLPLINEVFFEFIDKNGNILLLHQLIQNEIYQVIISHIGGLYRYKPGDNVKVTGKYLQTPCLEFVGRADNTSDLVGEKLTEACVLNAFESVFKAKTTFSLLIPLLNSQGLGQYILLTNAEDETIPSLMESFLCTHYHYLNARVLGQLLPLEMISKMDMQQAIHDFFCDKGMRWGNIKDRALLTDINLATELMTYLK
jgi:hypothetical protein